MRRRIVKVVLWIVAIAIGVPILFIGVVLSWGYFADRTNGTLVSSGITRNYLLYVPRSYEKSKPTPLIISFHPAATWAAVEKKISRWNELADQYGFIVVYPNGSGAFFDGFTPGPRVWPAGPQSLPRDVQFISQLIDKLETLYNIDRKRIYVDGISNGGGMAYALSCRLSQRIAAVGTVAAAHSSEFRCGDRQAMPAIAFHGTADKFALYQGGPSPVAPRPMVNIPEWVAQVAQRNQCKGDPVETRVSPTVRRRAYTNCAQNADVVLYTIEGGGHTWPGSHWLPEWIVGKTTQEIDASKLMWEFYMQHPRAM